MKFLVYGLSLTLLITPVLSDNTLNIVAHPDDDLLFLNPTILHDFNTGFTVRTVYLTSGDAGQPAPYWRSRQAGTLAAYAQMAGVENVWDESDMGVVEKDIPLYTLRDNNKVSVAFMRIPDGGLDGGGFLATGEQSLEQLWKGEISGISTVDGSGVTYSKRELVSVLTEIINGFAPDSLNSLDYLHDYGNGDHSDHTSAGLFANTAAIPSRYLGSVIAYQGYPIKYEDANVEGEDLARKKEVFYTYAGYDDLVCMSDVDCTGTEYEAWLTRLYTSN
ncbi:putative deacetylase LmbE-like domain-containing protein [Aspergillus cavernicola]|uniref:N-acetylglucosaminylphosphatidylinositol deacetylase n=1 Tax=Aspergillus cavernicola TaxID=176166 RepID=A0ABR4HWH1_9EURO